MPPPPSVKPTRLLARLCIGLFAASTAFPVVASVLPSAPEHRWLGVADVGIAAALVGVVPALLVLFFVAGHRINWEVLVVGLAWRVGLLLYTLPYLVAALSERSNE